MRTRKITTTWAAFALPLVSACTVACGASDAQNTDGLPGTGGAVGTSGGAGPTGSGGASLGSASGGTPVGGATGGAANGSGGAMTPLASGGVPAGGAGNSPGTGGAVVQPSAGGQGGLAGAPSGGTSNGGAAGSAGAAGTAGAAGATSGACEGGKVGTDSTGTRAGSEYGAVKYSLPVSNEIVSLKTVLAVPKTPAAKGTLFIWPGLQWLRGKDPAGLGNGILQPVLTWGASCARSMPSDYNSWWISSMYVNVSTAAAGPTGCAGGAAMTVAVGDALKIDMSLTGTTWKQTVEDAQSSKSVDFSIDLKGQFQDWATWAIEIPSGSTVLPAEDVVFTNSVLTFASPATSCQPSQRGPSDYFSAPRASADGRSCCIDRIVLRARGVPATTMP